MKFVKSGCLFLLAMICCMFVLTVNTNAGCYSGRAGLFERIAERQLERSEARVARAEARASTSCTDSASFVTSQVYAPIQSTVTERTCTDGSCELKQAPTSVTVNIQPAPVMPMQAVTTTTTRRETRVMGSGLQFFRFGSSGGCTTGNCK